jgi:phosphoribosylglycinamide formyltransferase 1
VISLAKQYGIDYKLFPCARHRTIMEESIERSMADYLVSRKVDLVVLAGYMRILKAPLLEPFRGRIINLHPSLLPSFPGLHAVRQALQYGVKITGCTVHYVDEKVDHGPILAQRSVVIEPGDTEDSLLQRVHKEEHALYPAVIEMLAIREKD